MGKTEIDARQSRVKELLVSLRGGGATQAEKDELLEKVAAAVFMEDATVK